MELHNETSLIELMFACSRRMTKKKYHYILIDTTTKMDRVASKQFTTKRTLGNACASCEIVNFFFSVSYENEWKLSYHSLHSTFWHLNSQQIHICAIHFLCLQPSLLHEQKFLYHYSSSWKIGIAQLVPVLLHEHPNVWVYEKSADFCEN